MEMDLTIKQVSPEVVKEIHNRAIETVTKTLINNIYVSNEIKILIRGLKK